jgi:Raf kinase inhibitor-like YbhB/YbcL family protein
MQSQFRIYSKDFKEGEKIPQKYTADGEDINPSLNWEHPPQGTKSFALIVEDPDAPKGTWIHWCLKNIPSNVYHIDENSKVGEEIANSWHKKSWGGPSPPSGTHRYYFKIFALDIPYMMAERIDDFYKEVLAHGIGSSAYLGAYMRS